MPAADRNIDVQGIYLEAVAAPADPFGCKDRGAGAHKWVEDDVITSRAVAHRVCNQRNRFHGGVDGEVVETPGHCPGHICLFESNKKWLFSGDLYVAAELDRDLEFALKSPFPAPEDALSNVYAAGAAEAESSILRRLT